MKRKTFVQILLISLIISFVLGITVLYFYDMYNDRSRKEYRAAYITFVAKLVESDNYEKTMQVYETLHTNTPFNTGYMWIVSQDGHVVATSSLDKNLPHPWSEIEKPTEIHSVVAHYDSGAVYPDYYITRLSSKNEFMYMNYYQSEASKRLKNSRILLVFASIALAAFMGLVVAFVYLQFKSIEAKSVLTRLEHGDLKARFKIGTIDEIGSLMLDFNRMSDEIERLVEKLRNAEVARKDILQQLGHDLRTPMTSLKTAADTLLSHGKEMSEEERRGFIEIIKTESQYFPRLIEDLFFISEVDEVKYKQNVESVDLNSLLVAEKTNRKIKQQKMNLSMNLNIDDRTENIIGDKVLLQRLVKNLLDNAEKFAKSKIDVTIRPAKEQSGVELIILDDGPGISDEEIQKFGQRRERRTAQFESISNPEISLGLGSMIILAIVKVHGATLQIKNLKSAHGVEHGTQIQIVFPV